MIAAIEPLTYGVSTAIAAIDPFTHGVSAVIGSIKARTCIADPPRRLPCQRRG
jgi:hypothetical protein